MNTEWTYMWSIVRGAKQGDVYAKWGLGTGNHLYKVVLAEDGEEIPVAYQHEHDVLDYCREVAEEFVQGEPT